MQNIESVLQTRLFIILNFAFMFQAKTTIQNYPRSVNFLKSYFEKALEHSNHPFAWSSDVHSTNQVIGSGGYGYGPHQHHPIHTGKPKLQINKKGIIKFANEFLGVMGPFLFPLPYFLALLPFALPAIPIAIWLDARGESNHHKPTTNHPTTGHPPSMVTPVTSKPTLETTKPTPPETSSSFNHESNFQNGTNNNPMNETDTNFPMFGMIPNNNFQNSTINNPNPTNEIDTNFPMIPNFQNSTMNTNNPPQIPNEMDMNLEMIPSSMVDFPSPAQLFKFPLFLNSSWLAVDYDYENQ